MFRGRPPPQCGPTHVTRSASSQLLNEHPPTQRLVQQCHSPSYTGKPSALFKPGLRGSLHHIWLGVLTQTGADLGESSLRRFVLAIDKLSRELRQHDRMVAQHAISTKVGRATVQ